LNVFVVLHTTAVQPGRQDHHVALQTRMVTGLVLHTNAAHDSARQIMLSKHAWLFIWCCIQILHRVQLTRSSDDLVLHTDAAQSPTHQIMSGMGW
jgi:hypothetical protein